MKNTAKEVEKYFREKLVAGEYDVVDRGTSRWKVLIDDYEFYLWVANGAYGFNISDICEHSFMFFRFTDEEKERGWAMIKEQIEVYQKEVVLKHKRAEYDRLKAELEIE